MTVICQLTGVRIQLLFIFSVKFIKDASVRLILDTRNYNHEVKVVWYKKEISS